MTGALGAGHKELLLRIARESLRAGVNGRPYQVSDCDGPLAEAASAFVTLTIRGALRGCTGSLAFERPLAPLVAELAVTSALRDPRFPPLSPSEEPVTRLEISVLTPPVDIAPDDVVIGTHGLIVEMGRRRGVLLPQVAVEHCLTRERFLDETCRKAGLPPRAWSGPRVSLRAFEAVVFGEAR
jgi:AmmeMemoRadiSam system protein A